MIEIKQSRKLHDSGYRLMEVKNIPYDKNDKEEIISSCADVIHIYFGNLLDGISLDITDQGIIRVVSNNYKLVPNKNFRCSEVFFKIEKR
jgi:hypothetical protein